MQAILVTPTNESKTLIYVALIRLRYSLINSSLHSRCSNLLATLRKLSNIFFVICFPKYLILNPDMLFFLRYFSIWRFSTGFVKSNRGKVKLDEVPFYLLSLKLFLFSLISSSSFLRYCKLAPRSSSVQVRCFNCTWNWATWQNGGKGSPSRRKRNYVWVKSLGKQNTSDTRLQWKQKVQWRVRENILRCLIDLCVILRQPVTLCKVRHQKRRDVRHFM